MASPSLAPLPWLATTTLLLLLLLLALLSADHNHGAVDAFSVVARSQAPLASRTRTVASPRRRRQQRDLLIGPRAHASSGRTSLSASSSSSSSDGEGEGDNDGGGGIDVTTDPRLYRIRLPRAPGIEWGTDLSFSFVYVRNLDPSGPASISGEVEVGDQLCELRPVVVEGEQDEEPINLIGAPFDGVMSSFAMLGKDVVDVDLVFFRGTKDELKAACSGGDGATQESDTVTITVIQNKGSKDESTRTLTAPMGCNLREILVAEGINVYQSVTRWTNCKGKQLCGTCIVNVADGTGINTNRKSMDEESTLRENPEGYRLSCVTFAYGDVTVETLPPVKAAQWTR